MERSRPLHLALTLLVLLAAGCQSAPPLVRQQAPVGWSRHGTAIESVAFGDGPTRVLYLASIHGDERAGTPILERFIAELESTPARLAGRRIVVVPVANPDGYANETRENARGVDLNRNFPSANWQNGARHGRRAGSEPETTALVSLVLAEAPATIVVFHEPMNCVDHDGPGAEPLARRMADAAGLPARKLGARPGSLGSWAGEDLGIPVITVELPRRASVMSDEELWDRYGPLVWAALE